MTLSTVVILAGMIKIVSHTLNYGNFEVINNIRTS